MIFDKMLGLIERGGSAKMVDMAKCARLFHFPINPHERLPKEHDEVQIAFLRDMFVQPFPVVAVEDNASCVVIQDLRDNEPGLSHPRIFMELTPSSPDSSAYKDGVLLREFGPLGVNMLSIGVIDKVAIIGSSGYELSVSDMFIFVYDTSGRQIDVAHFDSDTEVARSIATNWMTALEELMLLNSPDRFILERSPVKTRKNPKKILRSHERPVYTILKPSEIRSRLNISSDSTGRHVRVHERRAHPRVLRSEKFKAMRGKTIIIPATWVGQSEKRVGNHYYKVLLDK